MVATLGNFQGAKHWVGFKPQATPGTAETSVTTFLNSTSVQANKNPKHIERKSHIGTGMGLPSRKGWFEPNGKFAAEVLASQPQPFYWCMGTVNTTTVTTGVYLHTITLADTPVNLTCEVNRVYDYVRQSDVKIDKLTIGANVGETLTLALETLACAHVDGATVTSTPTFPTDVLTTRATTASIDGTQDVSLQDIETVIDRGLEQLPVLEDADGAPHVVRPKDITKVTGKMSFIDFPTAQLTKLVNATTFALVQYFEGDTIATTYKKFCRITLPACQFTDGFDNDISESVITGEANFAAFYDTTTSRQIKIEVQNGISSITA